MARKIKCSSCKNKATTTWIIVENDKKTKWYRTMDWCDECSPKRETEKMYLIDWKKDNKIKNNVKTN